ncbi:endonuclease NucS domain-containing protein [Kordiimonas sp.]|uniref:endonuclease NucS domain-containing protein n=1 Tax=Kordiimonas sp. TaxID=1970157 RepID=UPI003A8F9A6B
MQRSLRETLDSLETGLQIADGGVERRVSSGYIDILARAQNGDLVVIELKAGKARREAVGQILGYMGDLAEDEPEDAVRGIIVAGEFDSKVLSAVRLVPAITLKKYSISFNFEDC